MIFASHIFRHSKQVSSDHYKKLAQFHFQLLLLYLLLFELIYFFRCLDFIFCIYEDMIVDYYLIHLIN